MTVIRTKTILRLTFLWSWFLLWTWNDLSAQKDSFLLQEIMVEPHGDPLAHRIIKEVLAHKKENSPFQQDFTFKVYEKLWMTSDILKDSLIEDLLSKETHLLSPQEKDRLNNYHFFNGQHLFFNESVTEFRYKYPNRKNATIIASKTSGFKDPVFSVLWFKSQSFSIYEHDFLDFLYAKYVNPISGRTFSRYRFWLIDTTLSHNDTLFKIGFEPLPNYKNKGLKGELEVTSNGYGVATFKAESTDTGIFHFWVQHVYQKEANGAWFPKSLNTVVRLAPNIMGLSSTPIMVYAQTSIQETNLEPKLSMFNFSSYEIDEKIQAGSLNHTVLNTYRSDSLNVKELKTYLVLDSLAKRFKPERWVSFLSYLNRGYFAAGPINIDPLRLVNFNNHEGWRLGFGLTTNGKMLKWFNIGGYFAYGFKDQTWKYGGNLCFKVWKKHETEIRFGVKYDVYESGQLQFFDHKHTIFNREFYRGLLLSRFDINYLFSAEVESYAAKNLRVLGGFYYRNVHTGFNYAFAPVTEEIGVFQYKNAEMLLGLRLAFAEPTLRIGEFLFYECSRYPIITLQYRHGFQGVFGSNFDYNKVELKIFHQLQHKYGGKTQWCLKAGFTDRALPYSLSYIPEGAYYFIELYKDNIYTTMRVNEFLGDRFVDFFFRHNFGKMNKNKWSAPEIILCHNMGISALRHPQSHLGVDFKTMEKGYFESGIQIKNIFKLYFLGFGVGTFYRYGNYALPRQIDNFSFQIYVNFTFTTF